jgi:gluconolactonase
MFSAIAVGAVLMLGGPLSATAADTTCDVKCLSSLMDRYLAQLLTHDPTPVPMAATAITVESAKATKLGSGVWATVKNYPVAGHTFADPTTGQVVHYGATTGMDGTVGSIFVRLKVVGGKVAESEIFSRGAYTVEGMPTVGLLEPDILYTAIVPEARRSTRQELLKVVDLYMDAISQHSGAVAPIGSRCDRYQAGNKFTNVAETMDRGGGTCPSSLNNLKGQAVVNRRFSVVDTERGIVVVQFVIPHGERTPQNATNVAEIFKIVDRKVRSIEEFSFGGAWPPASGFADETSPVLPLVVSGATPKKIGDGFMFVEGPAADVSGNVYFTDIPNNRIHRWDAATGKITVHRENTGQGNGLMFSADGRLVTCEMSSNRVVVDDLKGGIRVVADSYKGAKLHMPNDLWIDAGGGIYFSDFAGANEAPAGGLQVYYQPAGGGALAQATTDLVGPNGLAGSLDGKQVYVSDMRGRKVWAYTVGANGTLGQRTLFADDYADGVKLDEYGNVYLVGESNRNSIRVYSPGGVKLREIVFPDRIANATFGGKDGKTLFVTGGPAVYGLQMNVRGAPTPLERAHGRRQ